MLCQVRITAFFLVAINCTALLVTDLGSVVTLIGSTGSTAVVLICPAAAHLLLTPDAEASSVLRLLAALMLLLGIAILPSTIFCS